jgi:hypothetical protein
LVFMSFVFLPIIKFEKCVCSFCFVCLAIRKFEISVKTTPGQFGFNEFCLFAHQKIWETCVLILFCLFWPSENLRSL